MFTHYSRKSLLRGFSVVEALIGAAVLVVIVSFAAPSFSKTAAKAEMQAVLENTEFLIQSGRNTARILETPVVMHLNGDPKLKQHSITFSLPDRSDTLDSSTSVQDYVLPQGVRIVSDESEVRFDATGMVEIPVQFLLVSNVHESVSERVVIK
jgi:Tfp pilus assembly protein FimT